ncbi:MAG: hypothetical protein D6714_12095, partial [Bacteroidetes bacterium]
ERKKERKKDFVKKTTPHTLTYQHLKTGTNHYRESRRAHKKRNPVLGERGASSFILIQLI